MEPKPVGSRIINGIKNLFSPPKKQGITKSDDAQITNIQEDRVEVNATSAPAATSPSSRTSLWPNLRTSDGQPIENFTALWNYGTGKVSNAIKRGIDWFSEVAGNIEESIQGLKDSGVKYAEAVEKYKTALSNLDIARASGDQDKIAQATREAEDAKETLAAAENNFLIERERSIADLEKMKETCPPEMVPVIDGLIRDIREAKTLGDIQTILNTVKKLASGGQLSAEIILGLTNAATQRGMEIKVGYMRELIDIALVLSNPSATEDDKAKARASFTRITTDMQENGETNIVTAQSIIDTVEKYPNVDPKLIQKSENIVAHARTVTTDTYDSVVVVAVQNKAALEGTNFDIETFLTLRSASLEAESKSIMERNASGAISDNRAFKEQARLIEKSIDTLAVLTRYIENARIDTEAKKIREATQKEIVALEKKANTRRKAEKVERLKIELANLSSTAAILVMQANLYPNNINLSFAAHYAENMAQFKEFLMRQKYPFV